MTSLWRHRGFLHLWGAQATSTFGTRIGREAIALSAVMLLGAGPLDLAWLNLAVSLPYLILGLAAGLLIDRVRRRPLLIATDLLRAGLLVTIPLAAWIGDFSLAQLLIVVFLVTACTLVFDAAHQSYVPVLIEKRWLLDANAKQESTSAASEVIGPPIGGLLVQTLGAPIAILCDAVSYVASALLLWRVPHKEPPPAGSGSARVTWDDLKAGFRIVFRHRLFRPLAIAKTIRAICGGAIGAFYVLYLFRDLKVSPAELGIIVGCGGAAAFAAAVVTTRIAAVTPAGPGMVAGIAAAAVGHMLLPLAGLFVGTWAVIPLLMLGQLISDFGLAYAFSLERALRQHHIENAVLGRAATVISMCGNAPGPIGAVLAGIAAEQFGLTPVLWICVAGYALSPVVLLCSPIRALPRVEAA
ncbi:MFS transporter [Dongia deserti]|uniref:MFS transporter n=1 Tax=Dongia deserti TaxID=2268030 RepID=UPI0025491E83|nr:MFS transporter [Dongia deserti]